MILLYLNIHCILSCGVLIFFSKNLNCRASISFIATVLKNDVTTKQIKEINTFETIYIELMFNFSDLPDLRSGSGSGSGRILAEIRPDPDLVSLEKFFFPR